LLIVAVPVVFELVVVNPEEERLVVLAFSVVIVPVAFRFATEKP
jgi:hypothetical protein